MQGDPPKRNGLVQSLGGLVRGRIVVIFNFRRSLIGEAPDL